MKYPFDVNDAILWMANMVDLVLVFFDPIGQALCKRTLDVVEALSYKHGEKIRYFLSKVCKTYANFHTTRFYLARQFSQRFFYEIFRLVRQFRIKKLTY